MMIESKACLFAYNLETGEALSAGHVTPEDPQLLWLHFNGSNADTRKLLKEQTRLDPLIIKSLMAEETRPRIEDIDGAALLILRGISFSPGPAPEDLVSIRLWVSHNRIISVGKRRAKAVAEIETRLKQGHGPHRAGEFIALLCTTLNDGIEPSLQELEDELDRLEAISLDLPDNELRGDLAAVRKQATQFRRHMTPQRDVINLLRISHQTWMTGADKWFMQDSHDRVIRFIEDLDALRDRSQILQDEIHSAQQDKLNKNLYMLSAITVIFMPLGFLTGLLGINVSGIPFAESHSAFAVVCAGLVVIAALQIYFMKKIKWL